jgi:hypothetical protein
MAALFLNANWYQMYNAPAARKKTPNNWQKKKTQVPYYLENKPDFFISRKTLTQP